MYAVLCPWSGGLCGLLSRVVPWSGGRFLFPAISRLIRVQVQSSRVQFGTKNDAAGYTLAEPRHISVKCGAGQSAACVKCLYKKGTLICRGSTRVYPVESFAPPKKDRTPGTSERFVANCGVGPSTRGQGDSASLVKPTQDQRREHKAVVSLVGPAFKVKADCCCAVLP